MTSGLFSNLINISSNTEEVYKDFSSEPPDWYLDLEPDKKLSRKVRSKKNSKKIDPFKAVNDNRSIINLQESILQNLKDNQKLINSQNEIFGVLKS